MDVEVSSGIFETIKTYTKASWEGPINGIRSFDIVIDSSGSDYRADFALKRTINLYFNEVLEVKGTILKRTHTSTGALRLEGIGFGEKKLTQAMLSTQAFSATNTSGVMNSDTNNILSKVPAISAGTIENQTVNNFRSDLNESALNGVSKLTELSGQDWSLDDANDEIDIENHKGSASSIGTLTDGIDVTNVSSEEDDRITVKKVTVIGKGYGANQVSGSASAGFTQGDSEITVVDKSLDSNQECSDKATKLLAIKGVTRLSYNFQVVNPFFSFTVGDVITLNSAKVGVDNVNLRIVKYRRVSIPNRTSLFFQVRGTGEREQAESKYSQDAAVSRSQREAGTMTQPSDDGTGSIGITGAVLDAPSVTSITGAVTSAPSSTSITGGVSEGESGVSVTGDIDTAGTTGNGYFFEGTTTTLVGNNTWRNTITSINIGGGLYSWHMIHASFNIGMFNSGSYVIIRDVYIRAKNTTDNTYWPDTTGIRLVIDIRGQDNSTAMVSGILFIPKSWSSKTYILQYKIDDEDFWSGTKKVAYSYSGEVGHTHGDNFGIQEPNPGHDHNDSFDTTDSNHGHSDSIDTTDSNHGHGDNISGSDSGHSH